jgi:hypothetical protein
VQQHASLIQRFFFRNIISQSRLQKGNIVLVVKRGALLLQVGNSLVNFFSELT